MQLRYAGPGPQDDGRGGVVRPGDVWEWPSEPDWGPWVPVDGDGGSESAQERPGDAGATQPPTGDAGSPPAASLTAPEEA